MTDKLALRRLEYEVKDQDAALLELQEECATLEADRDQYRRRNNAHRREKRAMRTEIEQKELKIQKLSETNDRILLEVDVLEVERDMSQEAHEKTRQFQIAAGRKHRAYNEVKAAEVQAVERAKVAEGQLQLLKVNPHQMLAFAWNVVQLISREGTEQLHSQQCRQRDVEVALQEQLKAERAKSEQVQQELLAFQHLTIRATSKGRPYEDWVRLCYMELLGHGVSASTCSAVVKAVIDSVPALADISLKDLPTRQAVDDMRLEAGVVARMHVCSEIEKHKFQGCALYSVHR